MKKGEKIKVLQIVEDLKIGGLERVIALIVSGLSKADFESEIWCLADGGIIAEELVTKGIKVRVLGLRSYHQPANIIRLALMMREEKFHIVHTHGYFASTFGRLSAIIGRIPVIFTHVHSTYYAYNRRHQLVEKILSKYTEKIICVSRAVQNFVVGQEGISKNRTCIIYNGADISQMAVNSEMDSLEEMSDTEGQHVVIITVASLTKNKGHIVLLNAFKKLVENHANVRLMIVGDGPMKIYLTDYTKELGLSSRVIFTGQKKQITLFLKISDIFVLNSIEREGLGIAVIEAMAAGLPVVGTSVGGLPELISDQQSGFVVKPGDSHELYCALKRLVDEESLRKRMGLCGKKIYEERFTPAMMNRQLQELYIDALKRQC